MHNTARRFPAEHLVVQDIFLTETAFHADVVLPASAWRKMEPSLCRQRVRSVGKRCRCRAMRARTGGSSRNRNPYRPRLDLHPSSDVFAEMSIMPSFNNITWDRLSHEGTVTYPCDAPEGQQRDRFRRRFSNASGRGKLVGAEVIPPDEMPDDEYPMILTTGRQLEHWHTGALTRRASVLDIWGETVAQLNYRDLKRLGWSRARWCVWQRGAVSSS